MVLLSFTKDEFLLLGLRLKGYKISNHTVRQKVSSKRFISHFYVTHEVCEVIFEDLQKTENEKAVVTQPNPLHFLLGLLYLKEYPTQHGLAAFSKASEKKSLSVSHYYVERIQALKEEKVSKIFASNYYTNALLTHVHLTFNSLFRLFGFMVTIFQNMMKYSLYQSMECIVKFQNQELIQAPVGTRKNRTVRV